LRRLPAAIASQLNVRSSTVLQANILKMQEDALDSYISRAKGMRDAAKTALDQARDILQDLRLKRGAPEIVAPEVRGGYSPLQPEQHQAHASWFDAVERRLVASCRGVSLGRIERWIDDRGIVDAYAFAARFKHEERQFAIFVESGKEKSCTLGGGISRYAPRLRIEPQSWRDTLLRKPLGLVRDVELGDPTFDAYFLVQADDEDEARLLLSNKARGHLVEMTSHNTVVSSSMTLSVNDGEALICWRARELGLYKRALEVLQQIYAGLENIRLVGDR
jgi:hypothetical protein